MATTYTISSDTLTELADAVRQLNGTSSALTPEEMIDGIEGHVCPQPVINSLSVTENGTYTAPSGVDGYSPVTVNVSGGGGGLEYEEGTWTPSADVNRGEISFSKTHTTPPTYITLQDDNVSSQTSSNSITVWNFTDYYKLFGTGFLPQIAGMRYSFAFWLYKTSSAASSSYYTMTYNSDNVGDTDSSYSRYWANNDKFYPNTESTSRYFRANRTYKWIAIWLSL